MSYRVVLGTALLAHLIHGEGQRALCGVGLRGKRAALVTVPTLALAQSVMDGVELPCQACADWVDMCLSKRAHPSAIHPRAFQQLSQTLSKKESSA